MSTRKVAGVLLLAIAAAGCSKPGAGPSAGSPVVSAAPASAAPPASAASPTEAPAAPEAEAPANPVRVIAQEGGFSYLAVDGDYLLRGMRFPKTAGAFERGKIVDYNARALGHSVGYNDPAGIIMTVYLYGGGGNAEGELMRALRDMKAHPSAPSDLEFLGTSPISVEIEGNTVEGHLGLAYYPDSNSGSQAIVFSIAGRFLKFRVTAPIEVFKTRTEEIRDLMLSFGRPKFDD